MRSELTNAQPAVGCVNAASMQVHVENDADMEHAGVREHASLCHAYAVQQ